MSAKEQAFELFSRGKTLDSPEVQRLGIASTTLRKYYYQWRGQNKPTVASEAVAGAEEEAQPEAEVAPAVAPAEVQLGSLNIPEMFLLNGDLYRVAEVTPEFVRATKLKEVSYDVNATMLSAIGQATLATYTMVKPVKKI